MTVLEARKLSKTYKGATPVTVLKEINLDAKKGESIAIMGKSGEGKTTLLHILGTLDESSGGELHICGKEATPSETPRLRNDHIGFVFQSFNLLEDYSVLDNLLMPARIGRRDLVAAKKQALELLETVGLLDRQDFRTKLLSGGEKQRVSMARALVNDPDIILADEPSGNLDSANSLIIHDMLMDLTKRLRKTLIVVTHDRELANLCDRILILEEGKLREE